MRLFYFGHDYVDFSIMSFSRLLTSIIAIFLVSVSNQTPLMHLRDGVCLVIQKLSASEK